MPSILLSNQLFSYEIERKLISSLRIRLKSSKSFIISCHHLTPNFIITKFISDHADWIIKNSSKIVLKQSLKDLTSLKILDQDYQIFLKKMISDSIVIFKDEHKIYINSKSFANTHLKDIIDKKFRPLALALITQEIKTLSLKYNFSHGRISVKNTTSRFGSCSFSGNLSFNWQIIFFPREVFTHIILHELNHLKIKDHSAKFWDQLAIYDPNSKLHNRWLKVEGTKHFIV